MVYACALRGVVDHLNEVIVVRQVDGGREGFVAYTDETGYVGDEGGTDGAVRGCRLSFDEDSDFHD